MLRQLLSHHVTMGYGPTGKWRALDHKLIRLGVAWRVPHHLQARPCAFAPCNLESLHLQSLQIYTNLLGTLSLEETR